MPLILPFIISLLNTIFVLLIPVLTALINFSLTRIPKIPSYFHLLKILYSDIDSSTKERRFLTGGLLVISSILTFMASSLIPFTAVPLIGAITSPIAAAVALVVALALLDMIFAINKGYYLERLRQKGFAGLDDVEADIKDLKDIFGKSWQKVKSTIHDASQKIYEEGCKQGINFKDQSYQNYVDYELEGLNLYARKNSAADYQLSADLLKKNNNGEDWTKDAFSLGTGATLGAMAGVGASAAAAAIFTPASIWTTIHGLFGISSGIVVSGSAYTLLTVAAPVGLGVLATVGIYSGLMNKKNKEEAAKMSKFLAEIIMAALPMAWIDGEFNQKEENIIYKLVTVSGIRKEEQDLVWQAIEKRQNFDEVMKTGTIFEQKDREKNCRQSPEERIKHRIVLCTAWEIAVADDKVHWSEWNLHNSMATALGISKDEVNEIRRLINLKHDRELWLVKEESAQHKNIRELYRLQSGTDNL